MKWRAMAGILSGWDWRTTLDRALAFAAAICGVRGATPDDLALYVGFRRAWGM
jgi:fructokinase